MNPLQRERARLRAMSDSDLIKEALRCSTHGGLRECFLILKSRFVRQAKTIEILSEPSMTLEQAEAALREVGDVPPMPKEQIDRIIAKVKEMAKEPRCPTCGQRDVFAASGGGQTR